jgi:Ca2+-binding EF-hand superfamily protein
VKFVQQDLSPESDCYRELDRNSDGKLTSTELRGFWLQSHFAKIDKNADDILTQDDTGEALWHFVADADLNEDGKIVQDERRQAFLPVFFIRLDRNEDGQISDEEIGSNAFVRRLDGNGDGTVTESEFIEAFASRGVGVRTPRFPVQPLTPEEEFTQNDQDANDHVSIDEAAEKFWKSIAEFDVNEDNAVDLTEYEQGLRKRKLEKAERFFSQMDRNSDGQASQDEVPSRLWERWHGFDSNGDQTLNKDEFMKAQTANIIPNDEQ